MSDGTNGGAGANGGAGGDNGAGANGGAGNQTQDWTSGLSDDLKGYVQNKGFKDTAAAIDSYRNLEKLMGAPKERLLRLPENDDANAWGAVYDQLGRPKDAKEYALAPKEGEADAKFVEWAQSQFHGLGLTKAQGDKLAQAWNDRIAGATKEETEAATAKFTQEQNALRTKWGKDYDTNLKAAQTAAKEFGASPEIIDRIEKEMGYSGVLEFFHNVGKRIGESQFQGSADSGKGGGNFGLSMEAARAKISELQGDPAWAKKYTEGDQAAKAEYDRLMPIAYP